MSIPKRLRDRARHVRRVATSAAGFGLKRLVRTDASDADAFGQALVGELDQLKGMAMKVGQILSYMDGALPEETQAALSRLQRGESPLPWDELAPVVEQALGAPVAELYDVVEPVAVASASIGQVHRGEIAGAPVAIKVQYPGIRDTFAADVTQLRRIAKLAGMATRVDGQAIVDDLRDRLFEECDYAHEARWQERFRSWFADDPDITTPAVIGDRSCETVLTTAWCDGARLEDFTDAPREVTDRAALALTRFAWIPMFQRASIHADPHPGNQLYRPDGSVVFLDFGCVRTFDRDWLDATRREVRAVLDGDKVAFRRAALDSGMIPRPERFDFDEHWAMQRHMWEPYLAADYHFDGSWIARGQRFSRPSNPNLRHLAIPPPWIWLSRLQWGLHAILSRLGARGDFAAVVRHALEEPCLEPGRPTNTSESELPFSTPAARSSFATG